MTDSHTPSTIAETRNIFIAIFYVVPDLITILLKTTTPIDPVFCHYIAYSRPTKRCF